MNWPRGWMNWSRRRTVANKDLEQQTLIVDELKKLNALCLVACKEKGTQQPGQGSTVPGAAPASAATAARPHAAQPPPPPGQIPPVTPAAAMNFMPGYASCPRGGALGDFDVPEFPQQPAMEPGVFMGYQPLMAPNFDLNESSNPPLMSELSEETPQQSEMPLGVAHEQGCVRSISPTGYNEAHRRAVNAKWVPSSNLWRLSEFGVRP